MGLTHSSSASISNAERYDWKPELPDFRDNIFKYTRMNLKLPDTVDLRTNFKEYYHDFGNSPATCIAMILDSYGAHYKYDDGYNSGKTEKTPSIRQTIKHFRILDEDDKEYAVSEGQNLSDNEKPVNKKKEGKLVYQKLCNYKNQIKQSLNHGYPVIFGFTVYESFEKARSNGILLNPEKDEMVLGGLCAIIVGYDNNRANWIIKHPLEKDFGDNGYLYVPYELLSKNNNLTTDFWRILVE